MTEFERMIEQEIPYLRRYALALLRNRSDADDLIQGCLARALAKEHLWQPGTNLRSWLFTIMHNLRISELRRASQEARTRAAIPMVSTIPIGLDPSAWDQLLDLDWAIGQLPEAQRAIMLLVGLEGTPYEEAAQILGIPLGTMRSRLARGRVALRLLLEQQSRIAA